MAVDALMQFLFENLFFVIIIIAGLLSFFKRLNTTGSDQKQQRKQPMPPVSKPFFGEIEQPERDLQPRQRWEGSVTEMEQVERDFSERDNHAEEMPAAIEVVKNQLPPDSPIQIELVSPSINKSNVRRRTRSVVIDKSMFTSPSRKQVVEGIIWAEVLGPPRAKRPYSKRYRYF